MAKDISKLFDALEKQVRNSDLQKVQKSLLGLARIKLDSENVIRFASLSCRVGIPGLGISRLRPIVRPKRKGRVEAKPEHAIAFAECLMRLGACREAERVLGVYPSQGYSEAIKILAHIHLGERNYHLAIPQFRAHIGAIAPGSYQSTVSKLNLSMVLLFEDGTSEAANILNEVIIAEENFRFPMLKGNCYRLLGILEYGRRNYEFAMQCFQKAHATFGKNDGLDAFLVRKWIALTQYCMEKGSPLSKKLIDSIRKEAIQRRKWESVRDIDYHIACFHEDSESLTRLYFGTSYPRFKDRIRKQFPHLKLPQSYDWFLGTNAKVTKQIFELETSGLKPAQALYRLMAAFTSDFYRSFNTIDLFQAAYPGESYSYLHSEQKLYQLSSRLRKFFENESLPFGIERDDNFFRLTAHPKITVRVREKQAGLETQTDHRIEQLKSQVSERPFTSQNVMDLQDLSRSTTLSLLKEAVEKGVLLREGTGRKTVYKFTEGSPPILKKAA